MPDLDGPLARLLPTPYTIDWISSPEIVYKGKEGPSAIYHFTDDEEDERFHPLRITFEGLDSIRVCRGEHALYPEAEAYLIRDGILFVIENSPWLKERFEYESAHYRNCYEFGGNVEEMLTDFRHFHFTFHDEFVDVIARGIWFELTDSRLENWDMPATHPFSGIPADAPRIESRHYDGEEVYIRRSQKAHEELERDAVYCSQVLFDVGTEARFRHQVVLRRPYGTTKTCFLSTMGAVREECEGIASIEDAWKMYENYRAANSER